MASSKHSISSSSTSVLTLLLMGLLLSAPLSTSSYAQDPRLRISAISVAPAVLPYPSGPPSEPPALSLVPDISPLFPTPAGSNPKAPSPSTSSGSTDLPIIPSSPSPPNPDSVASSSSHLPQPGSISPTQSTVPQSSSSGTLNPFGGLVIFSLLVLKMAAVGFW